MSVYDKIAFLIPLAEIEQAALSQIYDVAKMPECIRMAIMPDVHAGYAMPIGGVALMDRVISPGFVGFDIGCGMCLVDTGLPAAEVLPTEESRRELMARIHQTVPTGVGAAHADPGSMRKLYFKSAIGSTELDAKVNAVIRTQLGTLGSGNHFIEIGCRLGTGTLCVTIHSGSRRPGWEVGDWYMKHWPLLLPVNSPEGRAYCHDMDIMLTYALENRKIMLQQVLSLIPHPQKILDRYPLFVNENHNHAQVDSSGTVLHRKGATPADTGQYGVIPGDMSSGVYITRGLGNVDYLSSASHGAGRVMGRNQAKKTLSREEFESRMQGVVASVSRATLDESPMAYKDLEHVMAQQAGVTVEVVDKVVPWVNVKGQDAGRED